MNAALSVADDRPAKLRLLAGLLAMPEEESLPVLQGLALEHAWLEAPVTELQGMPLEAWQAEHTRLFVSAYPHTVCPPFQSAFQAGTMGGAVPETLAAIYRQVGLESADLPADYLGTILECAAFLAEAGNDELGEILWAAHIQSWVPRFAEGLQAQSSLLLYQRLGEQLAALFSA